MIFILFIYHHCLSTKITNKCQCHQTSDLSPKTPDPKIFFYFFLARPYIFLLSSRKEGEKQQKYGTDTTEYFYSTHDVYRARGGNCYQFGDDFHTIKYISAGTDPGVFTERAIGRWAKC
jgi:hypothetical protein